MTNCVWDLNRNYLVFRTNEKPIPFGKRYLVLNLEDKQHRLAAIAYAQNSPNLELAKDLEDRVQIHEELDNYLADYHQAARHSTDAFWTRHAQAPLPPQLAEQERPGLYAKYQICDRNADPAEGDFFVLSVDEDSAEVQAALACLNRANAQLGDDNAIGGEE
jgi:hypothetical protein